MRIVALVPAYNEEAQIGETIESLLRQTRPLDKIIVIPNNCTDRTADIARSYQVQNPNLEVMEFHGISGKKAGALNRALAKLNPHEWDFILQMDADTSLDHRLVEKGLAEFQRDQKIGGVCSRCFPKPFPDGTPFMGRFLWRIQNIEYGFSDSRRIQDKGKVKVLPGAVCIYRMDVLVHVARANRDRYKHKDYSIVWPEDSLVEDYELTLEVQKLGYKTEVGFGMFSRTDAMLTIRELKDQRFRWYGGTAATLKRRKFASEIRKEIAIQLFYTMVILSRLTFISLWLVLLGIILFTSVPVSQIVLSWWWMPVIGLIIVNYLDRFRFVRDKDLGQWIIVAALLPLEVYVTWDQTLTLISYLKNLAKPSKSW